MQKDDIRGVGTGIPFGTPRRGTATNGYLASLMFLGALLCAPTANAQLVKVVGHGAAKCERFNSDLAADFGNLRPYFAWAQGYMSGIIYYSRIGLNEDVDLVPLEMPIAEQITWIQNYCADSPEADFSEAVFALFLRLGGKPPPQ